MPRSVNSSFIASRARSPKRASGAEAGVARLSFTARSRSAAKALVMSASS